ncbi:MAG TPA: M20/M25/M40 family metallo-hydrolase [Planctomycetaceae bacterium]|nr:M20/M25/M40 family metallo-hydrolase [Planctomycetaceae bacterium]
MWQVWGCAATWIGLLLATTTFAADAVTDAKDRLRDNVKYLSSDDLEGRGVGTQGLTTAGEFVRSEFQKLGLAVDRVNGNAYQKFDLITAAKLGEKNSLQLIGPDGKTIELELGKDCEVCSFAGTGEFEGEVVFAGYGIEDGESKYNDFDGIDVTGKVVILMRRNPQQGNPKGAFSGHGTSRHAELRTKLIHANQHKAAAVLFVNDPYSVKQKADSRDKGLAKATGEIADLTAAYLDLPETEADKRSAAKEKLTAAITKWKTQKEAAGKTPDDELLKFGYAGYGDEKPIAPAFHVTQAQIDAMLKSGLKTSLADLEAEIDAGFKPKSQAVTGWKAKGAATVVRVRSDVANVIGILDGEGPKADETIVIGAHYDHVGRGGANSLSPGSSDIHNGADDNASGTVALLELARRLSSREKKLPRRLMFIAFTAEELGLLGSAKYVKEPVVPLEQTIAMFNMDMVGRLQEDKLTIFGSGTSTRWESELKSLNEQSGFKLTFKPEGFGPSDHSSFYGKKIPVLHFFTNNHPDYHRPTDDWEKLNIEGIERVVTMLEKLIVMTAENPERPNYIEVKQAPNAQRGGNRPYFGTIPDFASEGEGYGISGAAAGSPAEKGGLKGGDRIIALGENKVTGLDDFDLALRKFKPGEEISVTVTRDGKPVVLKVTLEPPR